MKRRAETPEDLNTRMLARAVFHHITEATGRPPERRGRAVAALATFASWLLGAAVLFGVLSMVAAMSKPRPEAPTYVDISP